MTVFSSSSALTVCRQALHLSLSSPELPESLALSPQAALSTERTVQAQGTWLSFSFILCPELRHREPLGTLSPPLLSTRAGARACGLRSSLLQKPTSQFLTSRHKEDSRQGEDICRDFKDQREEETPTLMRLNQMESGSTLPDPALPTQTAQGQAQSISGWPDHPSK